MSKTSKDRVSPDIPRHFIKEWRQFRGIGQRKLAELLDTSHVTVGRYERYETAPDLEVLGKIARALNTDIPSLLIRHPEQTDGVWDAWVRFTPEERLLLVNAIRGVARGRD